MSSHRIVMAVAATVALLAAGCASTEEWTTWRSRPAHFASAEHAAFSTRNRLGTSPKVTREDVARAREEGWWGFPVTVRQDQVLER